MNKHLSFIVYTLVLLACLLFLAGIVTAGLASLYCMPKGDESKNCVECLMNKNAFHKVMDLVSSISIVLGTNFGAALGISITQTNISNYSSGIFRLFTPIRDEKDKIPVSEIFRIAACYIYIIGLLISFVFFLLNKDECSEGLIPELTKSLYAAIVGALAVFLGVPRPKNPDTR